MSDDHTTIDNLEDALSALKKARADAAGQRTRAKTLQESVDALEAERDDLKGKLDTAETSLDSAEALIGELEERSGVDLSALETATSEVDVMKALDAAFAPLAGLRTQAEQAQTLKSELVYSRAAGTEYDPAKLAKIAPGLTAREVEKDGAKVTEYGIPGEKDAWTPLADAVSGWEASLKRDGTPAPAPLPKPLPTGGAGSRPVPGGIAKEQNARAASHLRPNKE